MQGDDPNALGTLFGQRFKELHGASFALPVANGSVAIKALLEDRGYEVFAFHSNGTGGKAMEELAVEGLLDALFDLSTNELTDEIFGGIHAGDSKRLLAGGLKGLPRLVLPGGLDVITLGEPETVPEIYRSQPSVPHNPHITLVRVNMEQMTRLANVMAERLNQAHGPVAVAIPKGGFPFTTGMNYISVTWKRIRPLLKSYVHDSSRRSR